MRVGRDGQRREVRVPDVPTRDLIGRVLAPALRLWLRSQADRIDELDLAIAGRNRQILGGYVPQVSLAARNAVYRGLHLGRADLVGNNIRINLGSMLRGQPFRLLEPIAVSGEMHLTAANLQASLPSPLLAQALNDLVGLLTHGSTDRPAAVAPPTVDWQTITLAPGTLTLAGTLTTAGETASPVKLQTGLSLASPQQLRLAPLAIAATLPGEHPSEFVIDLGDQVAFEQVELSEQGLSLRGSIQVLPAPEPVADEVESP